MKQEPQYVLGPDYKNHRQTVEELGRDLEALRADVQQVRKALAEHIAADREVAERRRYAAALGLPAAAYW